MAFSRGDVETLSAALGEPGWILDRRLQAWEWFEKLDIPGEKEEPWRYTNLAQLRFKLDNYSLTLPEASPRFEYPAVELIKSEGTRAGYLVQRGSDCLFKRLDAGLVEKGVIFTDLATAMTEHEELIKKYLFEHMDSSGHIFHALHAALFAGGSFLYVPRGVAIEAPIESQRWIGHSAGTASFPHTVIVAEEGAEVTHFERLRSAEGTGAALFDAGVEIFASPAAHVTTVTLQEFGEEVWHFQQQHAAAEQSATFNSLVVGLGGRFSRQEANSVITGSGAGVEMLGLYFAAAGQHFDFRTLQDHAAEHATSDLLYKGALRDNAHVVYTGMIHVRPNGRETDAYQTNRNLVLSDHAKADSKPELEIENNDVRCSHAASVGQMNEEEIFYLESRGIPRPEAQRLIVDGFFEDVISRVRNDEVKQVLRDAVEKKQSA
ncbi:MAG: Fe-S cluster assembly protein SufD [Actinomycetota bacterium]